MIYVFNIKFYEIMTNNVQSSPRPLPRCLWTVFAQHIVLNRNFYNCTFYSIDWQDPARWNQIFLENKWISAALIVV